MKRFPAFSVLLLIAILLTSCTPGQPDPVRNDSEPENPSLPESAVDPAEETEKGNVSETFYITQSEAETEEDLTESSDTESVKNPTGTEANTLTNSAESVTEEKGTEAVSDTEENQTETEEPAEETAGSDETSAETETGTVTGTETEPVTAHIHRFTRTVTKEPTCGKDGVATYKCECGESYTESIPATGDHIYELKEKKDASCGEDGKYVYYCKTCGKTKTEIIPKTENHSYSSAVTKEPSCSEEGVRTYTCGVCHYSYTEPINKTEHNFVEYDRTADTLGNNNEIHLEHVIIFCECSHCSQGWHDVDNEKEWDKELISIFAQLYKEDKFRSYEYYCKYIENSFPTVNNKISITTPRFEISGILFSDDAFSYPYDIEAMRSKLNEFAEYLGYTPYPTDVNCFGETINEDIGTWSFPPYLDLNSPSYIIYCMLICKMYNDLIHSGPPSNGFPCFYIYFKPGDREGEYWMFCIIC